MKRLISALMVKQAHKDSHKEIHAPAKESIITPEARDLAAKLGIRFVESQSQPVSVSGQAIDEATIKGIIDAVMDRLPPEKRDVQAVTEAVKQVIAQYRK
jgi:ethanolamine utilization protein EutQ